MKTWQNPQWNFSSKVYIGLGILLLVAAWPLPYGFYVFTKIIVCGFTGLLAYRNFNASNKKSIWPWCFLLIAVLFNPLISIAMQKEVWMIVDILLGSLFLLLAYKTRNTYTKKEVKA